MSEDRQNNNPKQDKPLDGSDQVAVRQAKLDQMRENGNDPFRANWDQTHTSIQAQALLTEIWKTVRSIGCGPYCCISLMGKASFLKVLDRDGRIQSYVRKDEIGEDGVCCFQETGLGRFYWNSRKIVPN
jgi:lysyl-tRNA synthetase class 2